MGLSPLSVEEVPPMKIRVGLIGLGDVWQLRHAPALRALGDRFEVRAVCDPVRHRAEQAAAEFHAEAVDGYHVLVQREDIDAVLVLSPQWFQRTADPGGL